MLPEATGVDVLGDQSIMAVFKKNLPTDNVITSLSYRAETLHDPQHIFFKNQWAYLYLTFAQPH